MQQGQNKKNKLQSFRLLRSNNSKIKRRVAMKLKAVISIFTKYFRLMNKTDILRAIKLGKLQLKEEKNCR